MREIGSEDRAGSTACLSAHRKKGTLEGSYGDALGQIWHFMPFIKKIQKSGVESINAVKWMTEYYQYKPVSAHSL